MGEGLHVVTATHGIILRPLLLLGKRDRNLRDEAFSCQHQRSHAGAVLDGVDGHLRESEAIEYHRPYRYDRQKKFANEEIQDLVVVHSVQDSSTIVLCTLWIAHTSPSCQVKTSPRRASILCVACMDSKISSLLTTSHIVGIARDHVEAHLCDTWEIEFWLTFAGSRMPVFNRSSYSPVAASYPYPHSLSVHLATTIPPSIPNIPGRSQDGETSPSVNPRTLEE